MRITRGLILRVHTMTICLLGFPLSRANVIMGNLPAVNSDFNAQFGPEASGWRARWTGVRALSYR